MMLQNGKINILIDGQFGSTGKGVMAGYIAQQYIRKHNKPIHTVVTNAGPNSGHTVDYGEGPKISFHIPSSALHNDETKIYLCPGSIIDPNVLWEEIRKLKINPMRIKIHPHAAVVNHEHISSEKQRNSPVTKIASTQKGVGTALACKIMRSGNIAQHHPDLQSLVGVFHADEFLYKNPDETVLMEVPQGFGLGINSGFYPHTTCREISIGQSLSDAQVHPKWLGDVIMTLRTYPIRVGNIVDQLGNEIGNSGPFFPDSTELSWDDIGVKAERTTVTKRIRRVATFSLFQYAEAITKLCPTHVFLNFANYMEDEDSLESLLNTMDPIHFVTHLGFGPKSTDVKERT